MGKAGGFTQATIEGKLSLKEEKVKIREEKIREGISRKGADSREGTEGQKGHRTGEAGSRGRGRDSNSRCTRTRPL